MINDNNLIIRSIETDEFKTKEFNRKHIKSFQYFSKKEFNNYRQNNKVHIIGDVKINQRKYTDAVLSDNPDKIIKKKSRKDIIGTASMPLEEYEINEYGMFIEGLKHFDLYEQSSHRHCIGYAWVGGNDFVRLTKFNLLLLIIPIILLLTIAALLNFCSKNPIPDNPIIDWADNQKEIESTTAAQQSQPPNCDFVLFSERTIINKDNQEIALINLSSNANIYDISYEVLIDGKPLLDTKGIAYKTGRIIAGNAVKVNLYSALPPGEYRLVCRATEYLVNNTTPQPYNYDLITTLVVVK